MSKNGNARTLASIAFSVQSGAMSNAYVAKVIFLALYQRSLNCAHIGVTNNSLDVNNKM